MYRFLLKYVGAELASWLTALWYAILLLLVYVTFSGPAAVFRYGQI